MYSPKPHGLVIEGGGSLTSSDDAYVSAVVRSFLNFKDTCGLDTMRKYYDLPDGGRFIVQHMGGIFKVIIYKQPSDLANTTDGLAKLYVPMLFCGGISSDAVDTANTEATVSVTISSLTQKRLVHYDEDADLPDQTLALKRFNVAVNTSVVPEFSRASHQYVLQRPTWYSGAMAEVMQIVGGYGKQLTKNANSDDSDEDENPLETVRFTMPDKTIEQIQKKLDGVRLPGYTGLPSSNGQFQYDYKFSQTHAVGFDANNEPWLLQITKSGLYAMPLPIIPATATSEFKDYVTEKEDSELLAILNRFGALPSGESFPTDSDDFKAWQRAGVIIKLCDMGAFYAKTAYSDSCGWTFNTTGSSGFNTCYSTDSDGYKVGYAYGLALTLNAATTKNGWINKITVPTDNVASVASYIGQLTELLDKGTAKANAIQYKLRRSLDLIIERAGSGGTISSDEVDYWNDLELDPIASHAGVLNKVGEGYLYYNEDYLKTNTASDALVDDSSQILSYTSTEFVDNLKKIALNATKLYSKPLIRFPKLDKESEFEEFTFLPAPTERKNCDTIIFGYFVGDDLKVVKYFIEWDEYDKAIVINSFNDRMEIGEFKREVTYTPPNPQGFFYTADLDLRNDSYQYKITENYQGVYKGTSGVWETGSFIYRAEIFDSTIIVEMEAYSCFDIGVTIPYFTRNNCIFAKEEYTPYDVSGSSLQAGRLAPWRYSYGLNHVYAGNTSNSVYVSVELDHSVPRPEYGQGGDPGVIGSIADKPQWATVGGFFDTSAIVESPPYSTFTYDYETPQSQTRNESKLYGTPLNSPLLIADTKQRTSYLSKSTYLDGCKVVFGTQQYANIGLSTDPDDRKSWGSTTFANNTAQHFIGVINE